MLVLGRLMSARAPEAIWNLWYAIKKAIPQAELGGIVGDPNHVYGYHCARADLPPSDYSVQLAADRKGKPDAASAIDVTLPPDLMRTCTRRLVDAARKGDPRLRAVREFCGTLDSVQTYPWQLTPSNGSEGVGTWDDSHLAHIHISILRQFADDGPALLPIAAVLAGTLSDPLEEVMSWFDSKEQFLEELADAVWRKKIQLVDSTDTVAASRILARDYNVDKHDDAQDAKP